MALDLTGLSKEEAISKAADYAGVPHEVMAGLIHTESRGNPNAVSSAGAQGAAQIMPATLSTWSEREGRKFNPFDFNDSVTVGALQLKENLDATKGNVDDALRMYNAGPDRSHWNNPETQAYPGLVRGHAVDPTHAADSVSAMDFRGLEAPSPEEAWTSSAFGLMAALNKENSGASHREYFSDVEKGVQQELGIQSAVNASLTGADPATQALGTIQAVRPDLRNVTDKTLAALPTTPQGTGNDTTGWKAVVDAATASEAQYKKESSVTALQKFSAAVDSGTGTSAVLHAYADSQVYENIPYDPAFRDKYLKNIDTIEKGFNENEVAAMRTAINDQDLRRIKVGIDTDRYNMEQVTSDSSGAAVLGYQLGAGLADPVGWAAGMGVGKAFQIAGVGSRAAFAAGDAAKGLIYAGGEGAAGNLLVTATLDAAGKHQSLSDYALAGGMGLAFGAGFAIPGLRRGVQRVHTEELTDLGERIQRTASEENHRLYEQAQAESAPNATPEEITARAEDIDGRTAQDYIDGTQAEVASEDQMFDPRDFDALQKEYNRVFDSAGKALDETVDRIDAVGKPVTDVEAATGAKSTYKLPEELGGAKPRYNFGSKSFSVEFGSDVDKAAYIISQAKKSKRDQDYLDFVMRATGMDEEQARAHGALIRTILKADAKGASEGGTITLEPLFKPESPRVKGARKRTVNAEMDPQEESIEGDVIPLAQAQENLRAATEPADAVRETVLGGTKDEERLFPRPDINSEDPTVTPLLASDEARSRTIQAKHFDALISDDATRAAAAEVSARSDAIVARTPIDEAAQKTVLSKVGWGSTASRMMLDKSNTLKAFAMTALENPVGAAGRRATAAITKWQRESIYMHNNIRDFDTLYATWLKKKGVPRYKDFFDNSHNIEFNRLVSEERLRREMGREVDGVDPEVKLANDLLDNAYNKMAADQRYVGTIGSARLPKGGMRGYFPRRIAAGMVAAMDGQTRRMWNTVWSGEFQKTAGFDKEFADNFARRYMERVSDRALRGYDVPATLHEEDAGDMMKDALRGLGMSEDQANVVMGRFSRGGPSYTKGRIDVDPLQHYTMEDGRQLRLLDLMDTNQMTMLRRYARRASGEVALAKYGIMGKQGLDIIRTTAQAEGASIDALQAFDQTAAEFLGLPYGTHVGKWADNARTLTSAIRLGGMGFTQALEYTNGIAAVGVGKVMSAITSIPRLLSEVHGMNKGRASENSLLGSMELYGGEFGAEGYQMRGMWDVDDAYDVMGQEALTTFDKIVRATGNSVRIISGHRAITAVQIRGMAEQIVQKSLRYIREGKEDKALADMGITPEIRAAFQSDFTRAVQMDTNGVKKFDISMISDKRAANDYMQSVYRGASQIIQGTYIGETGKYAHDGWLKMLTQFRHFGLVAMEKQWSRQQYTHGTAKALGYIIGSMSVAIPIHMARVQLNSLGREDREDYLDRNLSPLALARSAMNYVSSVGILPDVLDIGSSALGLNVSGGRAGNASPFIGGQIVPVAGVVNDLWSGISTRNPRKTVQTVLPWGNVPYLHAATNSLPTSLDGDR